MTVRIKREKVSIFQKDARGGSPRRPSASPREARKEEGAYLRKESSREKDNRHGESSLFFPKGKEGSENEMEKPSKKFRWGSHLADYRDAE